MIEVSGNKIHIKGDKDELTMELGMLCNEFLNLGIMDTDSLKDFVDFVCMSEDEKAEKIHKMMKEEFGDHFEEIEELLDDIKKMLDKKHKDK